MPIRVLDAAIVGRIAAGEVVERPASAAKELIENALDAGATSISVEIKEGGISYLRVTDNGVGIEPGQVRLAFENHATSKISTAEQLDDIRTLGFRGEALPSIAAVARVELTTRARGQDSGTRLNIDGGENIRLREIGCPDGTSVVVRDLFFNLPVRRAFLKKPQYEAALVSDLMAKMILGNPKVAFKYVSNGRTVYQSFGDGNLRHALYAVYGRETAEHALEISKSEGGLRIFGLIGIGEQAKTSRAHECFFINGRSVRCPLLSQALEAACRERVTVGTYPMCALNLVLPPTSVDVNVHPNKLEVRFRDEIATRVAVEHMLRLTFEEQPMLRLDSEPMGGEIQAEKKVVEIPIKNSAEVFKKETDTSNLKTEVQNAPSELLQKKTKFHLPVRAVIYQPTARYLAEEGIPVTNPNLLRAESALVPPESSQPAPVAPPKVSAPSSKPHADIPAMPEKPSIPSCIQETAIKDRSEIPYRLIGTLFRTYILLEAGDALYMIDQHAAHERLQYEKLKELVSKEADSQQLLTPVLVRLTAKEMLLVEENMDALMLAGYEIEPFGEHDVQIRAVPHILGQAFLKPQFLEVLVALRQMGNASLEARREEILQRACKSAVKGGDALSEGEIQVLLKQMLATGAPPTCPHGRPVVKRLSKREIEKMFKRIQ